MCVGRGGAALHWQGISRRPEDIVCLGCDCGCVGLCKPSGLSVCVGGGGPRTGKAVQADLKKLFAAVDFVGVSNYAR